MFASKMSWNIEFAQTKAQRQVLFLPELVEKLVYLFWLVTEKSFALVGKSEIEGKKPINRADISPSKI